MVFSLKDSWVSTNLEELLRKWFELNEYLESTYNLYFETLYLPHYNRHWFLSLAQALESYYKYSKRDYRGKYIKNEKILKKIFTNQLKNL